MDPLPAGKKERLRQLLFLLPPLPDESRSSANTPLNYLSYLRPAAQTPAAGPAFR